MQQTEQKISRHEVEKLVMSNNGVISLQLWSKEFQEFLSKMDAFYLVKALEIQRQTDILQFNRSKRNDPPYLNSRFKASIGDAIAKEGCVSLRRRILSSDWDTIKEEFC